MAESSVTQTGIAELRAAFDRLPDAVTEALKGVAVNTGDKVRNSAEANLLDATSRDKTPDTRAERTAAAITVEVDDANNTVSVISKAVAGDPSNLPIWFEHGTVRMAPKPYMRPAAKQHQGEYVRQSEEAAVRAAEALLT